MALIMYTGLKSLKTRAHGNWFEFQPGQKKSMNDDIGRFLTMDRAYEGFVELPEVCLTEPTSKEAKDAVEKANKQGRENIIRQLERVKHNLLVSLQRDYDQANIKINAMTQATDGELEALEHLALLKNADVEDSEKRAERVKELLGKMDGNTNSTNS